MHAKELTDFVPHFLVQLLKPNHVTAEPAAITTLDGLHARPRAELAPELAPFPTHVLMRLNPTTKHVLPTRVPTADGPTGEVVQHHAAAASNRDGKLTVAAEMIMSRKGPVTNTWGITDHGLRGRNVRCHAAARVPPVNGLTPVPGMSSMTHPFVTRIHVLITARGQTGHHVVPPAASEP